MTFLGVFLLGYFCLSPFQKICRSEWNFSYVTSMIAQSLYQDDVSVSSEKLRVKDFYLDGEKLYIFPLNGDVFLPVGTMVCSVRGNELEVVETSHRYLISHFTEVSALLYQYVVGGKALAKTNDFYLVEGEDVVRLAAMLEIDYVQV